MPRRRLRLLTLLTAASFLLINTPTAALLAARAPMAGHATAGSPDPRVRCPCCASGEEPAEDIGDRCDAPANRPHDPSGPCCPGGCSWCCVAKVPCPAPPAISLALPTPCLDQSLVEPPLLLPPAFCAGLIRPPRV
ncbi:MAG TPA: hypothetical protein VNK04_08050 [Gemmataceae bacterium]|jgi:hypothetical protein|nr:hypothetical protein [Gemmataceae bacterium]